MFCRNNVSLSTVKLIWDLYKNKFQDKYRFRTVDKHVNFSLMLSTKVNCTDTLCSILRDGRGSKL